MRAVVQRVQSARVTVNGETVGQIGPGLLAFVGVAADDGPDDVRYVAGKLRDVRIFEDDQGKLNRSVAEAGGSLLVVSQFTLYGDCRRGRSPRSTRPRPPPMDGASSMTWSNLRAGGLHVETGTFQAHMMVALENDGPVTILVNSRRTF